jgi:hypothetical protein
VINLKQLLIHCFLLFPITLFAKQYALGVVLDDTDQPVSFVNITYPSGKSLGQADSRGKFEVEISSDKAILIFSKAGYESQTLALEAYRDLMDVVVVLNTSVRKLDKSVVRESSRPLRNTEAAVPIEALEDAAGMRFDLTDHLAQLPGMSGQKDFSGDLSYNGSRPEDVRHYLGGVRVPPMRHLDIGFPGNLSVLNPHVLKGVQVHGDPGRGPVDQGLASALQFSPDPGNAESFEYKAALGTTVREFYINGPWFFWDSFVFSARMLDPSALQSMGEQFYTEFRKRDSDCERMDNGKCRVESQSGQFDLRAGDAYLNMAGSSPEGAAYSITGLVSWDEYNVKQDLSSSYNSIKTVDLIRGRQDYQVLAYNYSAASGNRWHLGLIRDYRLDAMSDTAEFKYFTPASGIPEPLENARYLGETERSGLNLLGGGDYILKSNIAGAKSSIAGEYEYSDHERVFVAESESRNLAVQDHLLRSSARMQWKSNLMQTTFSAGGVTDLEAVQPQTSLDYEYYVQSFKGLRLYSGLGLLQQYVVRPDAYLSIDSRIESAYNTELGLGVKVPGTELDFRGFMRYYPEPSLPEPEVFWEYLELNSADYAWASGVNASLTLHSTHHIALNTNISTITGEYVMDSRSDLRSFESPAVYTLPWNANRKLDMISNLRYYPRSDSMLSIILTHRASWDEPLYSYKIERVEADAFGNFTVGRRSIFSNDQTVSSYRTDIRFNLDLNSRFKPLDDIRFYFEIDNIFAWVEQDYLRFLGGDNPRQRSWVTGDLEQPYDRFVTLEPFLAKGLGLFVQFGAEGNFSF